MSVPTAAGASTADKYVPRPHPTSKRRRLSRHAARQSLLDTDRISLVPRCAYQERSLHVLLSHSTGLDASCVHNPSKVRFRSDSYHPEFSLLDPFPYRLEDGERRIEIL